MRWCKVKRVLFVAIFIMSLSRVSYADYIVKLNGDVTKFDDTKIECILNDWFLVESLDNLDVSYVQENYTYKTCDAEALEQNKTVILTNTDMSVLADKVPKDKVTVAILDTGVDISNEKLTKYIVGGYNAMEKNALVKDDCGHGTHVSGIVVGLSGSRIMPVKVLNEEGVGKSADIAIGIRWAVDMDAKVLNLSLGGAKYDRLLEEAVDYAVKRGCVVVCASGNTYGEKKIYPACLKNTISVGAVDKGYNISPYSNRGDGVDVYAIGDVTSYGLDGGYERRCGTSMACAVVTAEIALLLGK